MIYCELSGKKQVDVTDLKENKRTAQSAPCKDIGRGYIYFITRNFITTGASVKI